MFIAPAAIFFGLFLLLPILAVVGMAFTRWTGFDIGSLSWHGVANFRELGRDGVFGQALWHTVLFVVLSTVFLNVFGLAFALVVDSRVRGHEFLRVAMFLPLGISPVVTAVLWQQLLGPYGFVNSLLVNVLGVTHTPIGFLGTPDLAFATVIAAAIWQYSGYNMLLYYAGLQSLPRERVEAAAIDGAGVLSRVRWIVIPHLRPIMAVAVILNMIGGWKVFDLVYVLTRGGPNRSTEVLSTYLYQQAFAFNSLGYASAIALVIIALAIASLVVRRPIAGRPA
jgi:raffinose/stachyose/melibiose transport system permease protein